MQMTAYAFGEPPTVLFETVAHCVSAPALLRSSCVIIMEQRLTVLSRMIVVHCALRNRRARRSGRRLHMSEIYRPEESAPLSPPLSELPVMKMLVTETRQQTDRRRLCEASEG